MAAASPQGWDLGRSGVHTPSRWPEIKARQGISPARVHPSRQRQRHRCPQIQGFVLLIGPSGQRRGKLLNCAGNRAAVLKTGSEARGARAPRDLNFWKGPKGELLGSPSPKRNGASRAPGANYDEGGESRRCCRFLKSPRGDAPREPREGWSGSTWTTKEV